MLFVCLLVFAGATWYFLSDDERSRVLRVARRMAARLQLSVRSGLADDPLDAALRERTPWAVVAPVLALVNLVVFVRILGGPAPAGDTDTLVAWGANVATSTGNGQWWRLLSAAFVHSSALALVVNTIALLSAGRLLERLVGSVTFGAVYVMAAVLGSLASLWISPIEVSFGASAAIFGLYGMLLACWMWGAFQRASTTVRLVNVKRLVVPAAIFFAYNLLTGATQTSAEIAGVVTGFMAGLLLARKASERKPSLRGVAAAAVSTVLITAVLSEPVRGVVDVRPEIAAVISTETRTAASYNALVARFQKGWTTSRELSELIERKILPELQQTARRVNSLGRVPMDHHEVVADARLYLKLREEGWRTRVRALQKTSIAMLRDADRKDQAAMQAFDALTTSASRIPVRPVQ
jgi:rhomboid protease GluP